MIKACLSVCAWRAIDVEAAQAVTRLISHRIDPEVTFSWSAMTNHALIDFARSLEATRFLEDPNRGDVLLFVDTDIWFEPEDAVRLAKECAGGLSVCGGGYVVRNQGDVRPALKLLSGTNITFGPGQPPMEVEYLATGFLAIHRSVLERLAETVPVCVTGQAHLRPFFQPMIYYPYGGGETPTYLTEDWAFCRRALDAGFKIWLDPSIRLGHMGFKVFTVQDIANNGMLVTGSFIEGTGPTDMTGVVPDLAEYMGIELKEAKRLVCKGAQKELADQWREASPKRPKEVEDFYRQTDYTLDLANFNTSERWADNALRLVAGVSGRVCDFGGGIGSLAMVLEAAGCEVTYVELPSPHRKFAEWRFARHGMDIKVVDSMEGLRDQECIYAVDVLEHIHPKRLPDYARQMYLALKPGGQVRVNVGLPLADYPMHFDSLDQISASLRAVGFTGGPVVWRKPDVGDN